eukprot:Skav224414  [mRNA]  locus=scaffold657:189846:197596:+ [translate_table: standard]
MVVRRYRQVAKLLKLAQQIGPGGTDVAARAQQCLQRAEELEGGELRDLVRSMARFRRSDERSWQLVASVVTRKVEEIEVETMVRIAGSFSRVSQGNPEMLKAMIMRIKGSDCKLSCWSWADFMLSLQSARIRPDEQLVKAAADAWLTNSDTVKKLKMSYIMAIVKASLSLGQSHRGIILAISERVARRSQNLKPHDLPRVALAFGRAACKDDALMQPLCQAVRQKLPSLPKNRISWTLHGLSLMDCKDRQLLAELATAWASGRPKESIEVVRVFSALAKSGALVLSLCDQMAACSLPFVFKLSARQVARVLHACSQSNCQHVEFLESLGKAARGKLYNFSADELCAVSFAGAKLCVRQAQKLQSSDLQDLAQSMAELRCKDEKSWQQLGSIVTQKVQETKAAELVKIAGSFSVASQGNPEMLQAMMMRFKEFDCKLKCWSWADFMLSLQRAKLRPDGQLVKTAAEVCLTDFHSLTNLGTSYMMALIDASMNATVFHPGMFQVLSKALVHRMESLTPGDLSRIALAWGQAACKDEVLIESLCKALHQNLSGFPKDRISYTIHGLSLLDCKDKQVVTGLASAWATTKPEESIEVVHVMSALAKLDALGPSLCNQIAACSLHCLPKFSPWGLARILRLCSQAGCAHVEFLEALAKVASDKISEFSPMDLNEVALPAAKLSLAPTLGRCIPAAAVEHVSAFNGSELAWMIYSISRLSEKPGEYLPFLERAALKHVRTLNPADLRCMSLAWAETRVADRGLMDAVATRAVEVIDRLDPSTINQLAWAYSELQVTRANLFEALSLRCSDTIHAFATPQLAYTAFAFVRASFHDDVALVSIAREALSHLGRIDPVCASLLARAFIQADLESTAITGLLEGLAVLARQKGWTQLEAQLKDRRTDFQKQCAETVQEFLPSILVNQRHQMGPVLTIALEQSNGILLNLEVDPIDQELSRLNHVVRSRRDEFLENVGVEVLRCKVNDLDDLKYHLQQMFGVPAELRFQEPADLEGPDLGAQDESEIPSFHQTLWKDTEPGNLQSQSLF